LNGLKEAIGHFQFLKVALITRSRPQAPDRTPIDVGRTAAIGSAYTRSN
jgi:hypothetical protein